MSQAGIVSIASLPIATQYTTDSGIAVPALGNLNIVTPGGGTTGIATSGAGSTITITLLDTSLSGTGQTIGAVTADLITYPLGAVPGTYTFEVKIAGFNAATPAGAGYSLRGSVRTTGAAAALVPAQVVDEFEEAALAACTAEIAINANTAIIRVTGVAGLTIKWKAIAEYTFIS